MRVQADALGLPPSVSLRERDLETLTRSDNIFAELLGTDHGIVGLWIAKPQGPGRTEPVEVLVFGFGPSPIRERLDELVSGLEAKFEIDFSEFKFSSDRLNELREDERTSPEPPTAKEVSAARLLIDQSFKRAALGIASSGGLLQRDLAKQIPDDDKRKADEIANLLQENGLVEADLVVVCSKTGGQVLRVPNQAALDQAAVAGVNCACGAAVKDERIESALGLTELGRKLLNGSWWMTVLLMDELHRLGIDYESMLVEQNIDGDEIDCFADISGSLVIFELKDKEFSLGNAYSFGSKFGIYRAQYSVVVTTERVGKDAKEHFQKALTAQQEARRVNLRRHQAQIKYIEGLTNLRAGLEDLVSEIHIGGIEAMLRRVLPEAMLGPELLVNGLAERYQQAEVSDGHVGTAEAADPVDPNDPANSGSSDERPAKLPSST